MTMAKPSLAQDQTVEEILASIRQAINGDQSRSKSIPLRPLNGAMPPSRSTGTTAEPSHSGTVTPIHGSKAAVAGARTSESPQPAGSPTIADLGEPAAPVESESKDGIDLAIEQALDGLKPAFARADPAVSIAPVQPLATDVRPSGEAPYPPYETAPRVAGPTPVHETSRFAEPRPVRDVTPSLSPSQRATPPLAARSLLSPRTNAAVAASFDDLARVLASHGTRDIDQTVEDLLRPMLKNWLEDNLPPLVERLVREEIERVSRGRR